MFAGLEKLNEISHPATCGRCHEDTLLPHKMLLHIAGDPKDPTKKTSAVGFVCPHCRQVGILRRDSINGDLWTTVPQTLEAFFYKWLECEVAFCKEYLPLYALGNPGTPVEDLKKYAETWIWDG